MIGSIGVVYAIGINVTVREMTMSANPAQSADTGSNTKPAALRAAILSTRKLMMAVNEEITETKIQLANLERAHAHLKKTKQDLELLEQYPDDKLFQKLAKDELHAPKE